VELWESETIVVRGGDLGRELQVVTGWGEEG